MDSGGAGAQFGTHGFHDLDYPVRQLIPGWRIKLIFVLFTEKTRTDESFCNLFLNI